MKHWKKVISVMLTLTMVICLFSIAPVTANAAEAVTYTEYSWDGSALQTEVKTATDYTVVTSDLFKTNPEGLMTGTYVVNADTTIGDYFYIRKNQTVNLIVQPFPDHHIETIILKQNDSPAPAGELLVLSSNEKRFLILTIEQGMDIKTISHMLGHTDAGFTMNTYMHFTDAMQQNVADTMGNLLANKKDEKEEKIVKFPA